MNNHFAIRKANREDVGIIREMAYKIWPSTFKNILSIDQIDYMLDLMYSEEELCRRMKIQNQDFYLIEDKHRALGYLELACHYPSPILAKIHKIYILPSAQNQGLGQKLIWFAENQAISENCKQLTLNVNKFNPAITFYEKSGFKKIAEEVIDIGNGFVMDDYVYEKTLT
ncbi:GNAT family N-acetyltransferase [Membranihabitans marinus]|uniref:GNAT family N-acetyltransferase n=1 Tax=Membranihabitans marinus TaxID=1227546 RepID=UPI001F37CDAE|nr:GNAT family N-acetyltransferase [Membranihabitans marinus]